MSSFFSGGTLFPLAADVNDNFANGHRPLEIHSPRSNLLFERRSRTPLRPLSLRMMSRADLSKAPRDWAVVDWVIGVFTILLWRHVRGWQGARRPTRRRSRLAGASAGLLAAQTIHRFVEEMGADRSPRRRR